MPYTRIDLHKNLASRFQRDRRESTPLTILWALLALMPARLPARCRSYLLNEADNRFATRRSQSEIDREKPMSQRRERGPGGHRRGDDDKSDAAFNYGPISAPSSRCAPLERILLKAMPFSRVYCQVCASDYRLAYLFCPRLASPRAPRASPSRSVAGADEASR